jgi:general secretion pathway protein E
MIAKSIGEILVGMGVFSHKEYEEYLHKSKEHHKSLEAYLLTEGLVREDQIARARARKYGFEYIESITDKMVDTELLAQVPFKFLRDNVILPLTNIEEDEDIVTLVINDPLEYQAADELTLLFSGRTTRAVASKSTILDAINKYYPLEGTKEMIEELEEDRELTGGIDLSAIQEEDILGMASEAPIIKLVNHILYQAVKREASDIHIEPFERELHVRYRIDGVLHVVMMPPKRAQSAIISRIKIMANLNIAEKRQPQDGRIQIKIADKPIDIRVSVLPVTFGERVVMRLLDKSKTFTELDKLGFSKRDYEVITDSIAQPNGIILVTGPTGSGKTTTLYSILNKLNRPEVNIITVEDPVEYQMAGIGQVQVKEQVGLTFAAALRSILRQDPDIVMIGETRDFETAQIAIQAALTGHLVLSTLHTNSAAATITRLLDMGIEPFLIASTLLSVTAQRLVRKLCQRCKEAYHPDAETLRRLGISEKKAGKITFYRAVGCEECSTTGYRGRLPIFEIMKMSNSIAQLTMERADAARIQRQAIADGMTLLIDDGIRKIEMGLTTLDEVLSVAAVRDIHEE